MLQRIGVEADKFATSTGNQRGFDRLPFSSRGPCRARSGSVRELCRSLLR